MPRRRSRTTRQRSPAGTPAVRVPDRAVAAIQAVTSLPPPGVRLGFAAESRAGPARAVTAGSRYVLSCGDAGSQADVVTTPRQPWRHKRHKSTAQAPRS